MEDIISTSKLKLPSQSGPKARYNLHVYYHITGQSTKLSKFSSQVKLLQPRNAGSLQACAHLSQGTCS